MNAYSAEGTGFATSAAKDLLAGLPAGHYQFFEVRDHGSLPPIVTLTPWCNVLAIPEGQALAVP